LIPQIKTCPSYKIEVYGAVEAADRVVVNAPDEIKDGAGLH
jgi:hypothetical protein